MSASDTGPEGDSKGTKEREAYMEGNCAFSAGESGEEIDMSVCGEKGDLIEPVEERKGASRAMAESARPSTQRRKGRGR